MTITQLKSEYITKLQSDPNIETIKEKVTIIEWIDGFTGDKHIHLVDLTIYRKNGSVEHRDFAETAAPLTKYLYAQNQLDNWLLITIEPSPIKW